MTNEMFASLANINHQHYQKKKYLISNWLLDSLTSFHD